MSATLLACSRAARNTAFTRYAARTLATEAAAPAASDSTPPPAPHPSKPKRSGGSGQKHGDNYSVWIRAWDEIDSMPTFFAMLRGVEKRFGRVRDFRVGRDYDVSSKYTTFFIADLADKDAWDRIPEQGTNIKVEVPVVAPDRPGGIGLEDLQGLLQPQDWDPEVAGTGVYSTPIQVLPPSSGPEERKTKVVELIIRRSTSNRAEPRHRRRKKDSESFGVAFHSWGGFYQPTSSDAVQISPEMKRILDKWAPHAAARNRKSPTAADASSTTQTVAETNPDAVQEFAEHADSRKLEADTEAAELAHIAEANAGALRLLDALRDISIPTTQPAAPPTTSTQEPSASASSASPAAEPDSASRRPARLSPREKILLRARQHAKTPLPSLEQKEAEERKAKEEEEARKQELQKSLGTMRERLLKLMGGNWS